MRTSSSVNYYKLTADHSPLTQSIEPIAAGDRQIEHIFQVRVNNTNYMNQEGVAVHFIDVTGIFPTKEEL